MGFEAMRKYIAFVNLFLDVMDFRGNAHWFFILYYGTKAFIALLSRRHYLKPAILKSFGWA